MVARCILRLVGAFLLLIQHDQADILQRRKHRASRTEHDMRFAAANTLPLIVAFRITQPTVQQRHLIAEIGGETRHHLRRQRDFRHQDHDRLPRLEQLLRQTDIHQRFTAAGHTVQQRHACLAG